MATIKSVSTLVIDGDWIESKDQSAEGLRLIQTGNIGVGEYLDKTSRAKYISEETFFRLNCTELQCGDVLISRLPDPIGRACIVPNEVGRAITAVDCTIVRLNPQLCDSHYFIHYTQSGLYQARIAQFFAGSTRTRISRKNLEQIEIPLPDLPTQRHIASSLDKVSDLISLRKRQLVKLDELVKSRFVEMFGDPETNPYKWSISKLSEFCDLQNGYAFKSQDYLDNSSVLNCRMSNIRPDGGFDAEYHPKYLPDTFWEQYKEYRLVDGDVIIAMTDMASDPKILGVPTIVRTDEKKFLLNQRVGKLTFYDNKAINNVYLMFVLSQKHIRQQLVKSAGGSTQINVGKPAVLSVEFFVPPMELQEQFAAFTEQTDKSKLTILQSLDKLETLKKALMQEYFG